MAGGGLVTLPNAFVRTTFVGGLILIGFMTLIATFTAYALGKCWDILQIIWPEYREHCRKPYPEIGYRAFGGWLKHVISFSIDITLFGIGVVFLLLSAENIDGFLRNTFDIRIGLCFLILIIAVVLLPVLFLKSPADFWWIIILAMMATTGAVILIMIGAGLDYKTCGAEKANFPNLSLNNFFLGLGSVLFAYGGHGAFPTIQHDMKKPSEFTKSSILAFIPVFRPNDPSTDSSEVSVSHRLENGKIIRAKGLNWLITAFFVVGDMAGGGLVTLPNAFVRTTFVGGLILIGFMTLIATFTAYALGKCWDILQIIWPEYREHCRKPYPEIGYRAFGGWLKHVISFSIDITLFGIGVVFLLLSAENIDGFLRNTFDIRIGLCFLIFIIAVVLLPVLFLKSPADFWWIIILAMMATTGAVILIMIGAGLDYKTCGAEKANFPNLSLNNFFLGLGSVLFAYGGHGAFPTIQHDMKKPSEFTKSSVLAFILIGVLYLPVSILGYASYGDSLTDNVIGSIQTSWIQQITNLLITFHCLFAMTMIFNPLNQEIEEIFHIPH
uniref:Amino acid transporter transmembrane domain-containing protein n=1 Tax=Panagrolaimus sp. JU765 TaxID=591449 RepID=A0AC34QLM6_9BILA